MKRACDREIGEVFEFCGKEYTVKEWSSASDCFHCLFFESCSLPGGVFDKPCDPRVRIDGKKVFFPVADRRNK